jgi:hypothetical protein
LVATGHDPLHAAYLHGQNYLSVFGELASRLSEFETYRAVVARAEETYVPGWPPMSPVSVSFFTSWALLDLLLGETNDTICSCALEVGKVFGMSDELALTLEVMEESAMGIYEHLGGHDGVVGLRNIVDGETYPCIVPSSYAGRPGELWYVRLLRPLNASFNYGVAFTSPYVLLDTTKADWLAFLARQERMLFQVGAVDDPDSPQSDIETGSWTQLLERVCFSRLPRRTSRRHHPVRNSGHSCQFASCRAGGRLIFHC